MISPDFERFHGAPLRCGALRLFLCASCGSHVAAARLYATGCASCAADNDNDTEGKPTMNLGYDEAFEIAERTADEYGVAVRDIPVLALRREAHADRQTYAADEALDVRQRFVKFVREHAAELEEFEAGTGR